MHSIGHSTESMVIYQPEGPDISDYPSHRYLCRWCHSVHCSTCVAQAAVSAKQIRFFPEKNGS